MDWFKHSTGSHEDPDISDAWDLFGDAGPTVFWTILEVFGAEYSHLKDGWLILSIPYFERKTRRKFKKSEKILEFFEKRERIYFKKDQQTISLTIPKFIKIASNWTIRPRPMPTEAPPEATPEAPHAKEEEEKKKKNKNKNKDINNKINVMENISLTDKEIEKLQADFGGDIYNRAVRYLSDYKKEKNYKTMDDNLTIRRWVIEAVTKQGGGNGSNRQNDTRGQREAVGKTQSDGAPYPVDAVCTE